MKRVLAGLVLVGMIAFVGGCIGRAFREGAGLALGAKANVVEIKALPKKVNLGPVAVEPMTSAMNGAVSRDWLTALAAKAKEKTTADEALKSGKLPVNVAGAVIHLEGPTVADQAFGPAPEVIVRVTVTDSAGQVLGVANVLGRARGTTSSSQEDLAEAFATGLVKWLRSAAK